MITHEQTMQLVAEAQQGKKEACQTLLVQNAPLLKSIIKRYLGKHVEYEDLYQIASIGLLKAIKNFSTQYNVRFSTYAVPMILGEIKRHMRDDGYLKVSRSLKSLSAKATKYVDEQAKLGLTPTIAEIAQNLGVDSAEVVFALDATRLPVSLYEKCNDNDGKETQLIDHISTDQDKKMIEKVILNDMLDKLDAREKKIVVMRYFRDMTQGEIATKMGVSQVQISRLENKILKKLKELYLQ